MPNVFGTLNIPAANGPGAAFNLAGFAYEKTFVVQPGDSNDRTTIEFSCNGTHWFGAAQGSLMSPTLGTPPSFFTFDPRRPDKRAQGFMSFGAAVQFCRVNRFSPLGGPAPSVGVAGDDVTNNQFGTLAVPAGNATGPAFNPGATFGSQWTFQLGGTLTRGNLIIDASIDGLVWVAVATFNAQQPSLQVVDGAFFALRVRKTQTLESEIQVVSFGNAGGEAGGCCTLAQTYEAGAVAADQTISVDDADGGPPRVRLGVAGFAEIWRWENPRADNNNVQINYYTDGVNAGSQFLEIWRENLAAPRIRKMMEVHRNYNQDTYSSRSPNFGGAGLDYNLRIETMQPNDGGGNVAGQIWTVSEPGAFVGAGAVHVIWEKTNTALLGCSGGFPHSVYCYAQTNDKAATQTLTLAGASGLFGNVLQLSAGANVEWINFSDWLSLNSNAVAAPLICILRGAVTFVHNAAAPPAGTRPMQLAGSVNFVGKLHDVISFVFDSTAGGFWQETSRKIS